MNDSVQSERPVETVGPTAQSQQQQVDRYENFYQGFGGLRRLFRFDARYRCRRIHEVFTQLGIETGGKRVLDVGFGWGHLLGSFPTSCHLTGADISLSAVERANDDPSFGRFASAQFFCVGEDEPWTLPEGPFDLIVSSHALEHCYDDAAYLEAMRERLAPGGHVAIFVPIEEPDYIKYHVRSYSEQSIVEAVWKAGFELVHHEGSMQINGHIWRLITIPSRRRWPVIRSVVDAYRLFTLSLLPYPALRAVDRALHMLGFGARQALVIGRRRS